MRRRLLGSLMLLCYSSSLIVSAAPPVWWSQVGADGYAVIDPTAADPNPQGPANIAQAKFMAKRALESLRAIAPSTATHIETDLVGSGKMIPSWEVPAAGSAAAQAQRSPLLVGQLKAIAAPFYQHLHALDAEWLESQLETNQTKDSADSSNYYPWTSATTDDANQAIATIGQLKAVFSLEFGSLDPSRDSDGDGLTNAEEIAFGSNPNNPDSDGDGLTDAQEKFFGTDPKVADSQGKANGTIQNGDFSQIGSGPGSSHEAGWDYWSGIPGWKAVNGTNIELQTIWPKSDGSGQYCELKAHPAGNYGITQQVPTEHGKAYILAINCKARPDVDPNQSIFNVRIDNDNTTLKTITPTSDWTTQYVVFTANYSGTDIALLPAIDPDNTVGCLVDNVQLLPVEFINMNGDVITQIPLIDQDFFNSLVNHIGTADTSTAELDAGSGDGPSDWGPGYLPSYTPPALSDKYKFKIRIGGKLWTTQTASVQFEGFDETGATTEQTEVEMTSSGGGYVSTKAICAVAGQSINSQVKNVFTNVIFFDPVHFKVKTQQPGGSADLTLVDKATTMVFPAIRWKKSGDWSELTDAYNNGKIHPEPSGGSIAFDYDHNIELIAVVRVYDAVQKKLRYFCGAADHPTTISVVEQKGGSRKTVTLESLDASPEPLKETVKWFNVEPDINMSIENRWGAPTEDEKWADLEYREDEVPNSSGQWKISVGGDRKQGVNRYKVTFGSAESPGAQFRQNTVEDHRISNLVMRVIVKGDYPTSYLKWASTYVNVPFVDGSHPRQVDEYIAIDCADTCLKSWIRDNHSVPDFANQSAQSIVTMAQNGTYTMVLAPTPVYPETDAEPTHVKWSQVARPQPGDLIIWDWPAMKGSTFDHATIYVGTNGAGLTLASDGSDKTIYAGSTSFQFRVRSKTYKGLWELIQATPQSDQYHRPVRICIVRLK